MLCYPNTNVAVQTAEDVNSICYTYTDRLVARMQRNQIYWYT